MKHLILIIAVALTTVGCASNPFSNKTVSVTTTYGADGRVLAVTESGLNSKDYSEAAKSRADATANAAFYNAQAAKYTAMSGNPLAIAINTGYEQLGNKGLHPTNTNDLLIAQDAGRTARWGSALGLVNTVAAWGGGAYVAGKAIDAFADNSRVVADSAGNRTTINGDGNKANTTSQDADNGSVISDSGNYTEQTAPYSGIATEPLNFADTGLFTPEPEEPIEEEGEQAPDLGDAVCDTDLDRIVIDGVLYPDCSCGSYEAGHCPS